MNDTTRNADTPAKVGQYRPSLAFYHANARGTGCAMKLSLHPAHDDTDGCIMMTMANQRTIGDRVSPNPVYPTFDWEGRLTVKLDFTDLSRIVQVFHGERESLGDGKGLYHQTARFSTSIVLRHIIEPESCYSFELYRKSKDGKDESSARIVLSDTEAFGLCRAMENSFGVISFGIPMLVEHDTTAYRREAREARNANAA